ncbi:unnamed protein product [Rangifer tarandus platyrhynchus]|uniref:Uncharacterized protein n=1 Tax=Rangifer tarandus platyrhynchus TaxID=3082113 RepID=A0ABN8ZRU6_RANTA|nr:unnamed protein product [Rangifer tarandus platyrhynchus]
MHATPSPLCPCPHLECSLSSGFAFSQLLPRLPFGRDSFMPPFYLSERPRFCLVFALVPFGDRALSGPALCTESICRPVLSWGEVCPSLPRVAHQLAGVGRCGPPSCCGGLAVCRSSHPGVHSAANTAFRNLTSQATSCLTQSSGSSLPFGVKAELVTVT